MKTLLRVRINPRSSRNQVTGWQDGVLSVKLTAPPVEGGANKAAIEFVADQLGVKKSQVTLVSGQSSREKTFEITGLTSEELQDRLTTCHSERSEESASARPDSSLRSE